LFGVSLANCITTAISGIDGSPFKSLVWSASVGMARSYWSPSKPIARISPYTKICAKLIRVISICCQTLWTLANELAPL
jgi:hypothetical protein